MKASDVKAALKELSNPSKAEVIKGFFKTGKGEYGEGDIFLGLTVPQQRSIAKQCFKDLSLSELDKLLSSKIHEERLTALLILVLQYGKAKEEGKQQIITFYLEHLKYVNNWDLVDSSAHQLLGEWLLDKDRKVLYKLAKSKDLWEKRVAIISTYAFIRAGEYTDTFAIAEILMNDQHDLIHKAVGWMLREVGKRVDEKHLRDFLKTYATQMPRTALRYSIEHFSAEERKKWLKLEAK